jgi:PKD repeat protein
MGRRFMILCIAALMCMNMIAISVAAAKTWDIYATDPAGALGTIMDQVKDGDTVFFHNGEYKSPIFGYGYRLWYIPNITWKGESRDGVIINQDDNSLGIQTRQPGIKFEDLTFRANPSVTKILVRSSDVVINNCVFTGEGDAVKINTASTYIGKNCTITNSIFTEGGTNRNAITLNGPNNKVINNTFNSNYREFYSTSTSAINNEIYLNTVIGTTGNHISMASTQQSFVSPSPISYTYNGVTYNKQLGNYWSDHAGTDADGDGIEDTPFTLATGIVDPAPLMQPVSNYFGGSSGPAVPVAAFNGTPLSGLTPLTVQFKDESTNTPASWTWDFGDGTKSTEQNASHTYTSAGNYTVILTVANAGGSDSEMKVGYIAVSKPLPELPVASFTAAPASGDAPLTVNFTDQSTGTPTSWTWDLGDGTGATEQNVSHTYTSAGNYTVKLTVTNAGGSDTEVKTEYITVSLAETRDLTITGIVNTVPSSAVFARETNPVTIPNIKNTGTVTLSNISMVLYASDVSSTVPINTTTISSLAAGGTTSVTLIDPTIRNLESGTVTYTAVVDPDNLIIETNEANNNKSSAAKPVKYNGYKGKGIFWEGGSNITTKHTFDLQGNLLSSTQPESAYKGVGGWGSGRTETWSASDFSVPRDSTIEKAYLYFAYNWDQTAGGYPWLNLNFNGNILDNGNLSTANGTLYRDWSNFGAYADYKYGLCVYDVTDKFSLSGNSLVTVPYDSNNDLYGKLALYPSTLVLVYKNSNETRKQIFINEECDELGLSASSYGTTLEEATAYAHFANMSVDVSKITNATLYSFVGSAGPKEGNLLFNGNTIATNAWQGTSSTSNAQVFNVKNYLTSTNNEAGIQGTTSGGMDALQQILVIEYTKEIPDTTKPVIDSVVLYPANTTAGSTISISVNATDDKEVTGVTADDTQLTKTDGFWQGSVIAPSTVGSYSLSINASDTAGNINETSVSFNVVQLSGSSNIAVSPKMSNVTAGSSVSPAIVVKNAQSIDDIFKVWISISELPAASQANLTWVDWTEQSIKLRAGEEVTLPIKINVPTGTTAGLKLFRTNVKSETTGTTGFYVGYLKII